MSEEQVNPKVIVALTKQLNELSKNAPDGVRVVINEMNALDIQAEIDGPIGTPYEDGLFKMKLIIPNDFPRNPPKGYFLTKIFHPNVSEKGEICVNTLKKDWNPAQWSIYHIFEIVKCLLIVPFPESALNEEAAKLFMDDYKGYCEYAKLLTGLHAPKATKINQNFPNYFNSNKDQNSGMKENFLNTSEKGGFQMINEQNEDVLGALNNQNYDVKKPQISKNIFTTGANTKKEKDVKKWLKRI